MERGSGGTVRCRSPWGAGPEGSRRRGPDPARPLGGVERRGTKAPAGRLLSARLGSAGWAGLGWQRLSPRKPRAGRERRRGASPGPLLPPRRRREAPARALPSGAGAGADRTCRVHRHNLRSGAPAPPAGSSFPGPSRTGSRRWEEGADIPAAAARPVAEAPPGKLERGREGGGEGAAPGAPGRGPPAAAGRGLMLRGAGWRRVGSLPGPEQLSCPGRSALGLLARGEPLGSRVAQSGQCKDGKAAGYSE